MSVFLSLFPHPLSMLMPFDVEQVTACGCVVYYTTHTRGLARIAAMPHQVSG